ncbi:hypothetical protein [Brevundimonas sp. Root1279]|uniref:hypothetical protein n=1 Tax=Brevundimonas sp. Root1279 TaxID=1736443 RepID=UPI000700F010|nr:hypothetical protein [Brevundimonas sp. Root1279]KQW86711.1 hypothetical protein ASC65_02160 [Brevundimonas sp. Root1279]
MSGPTVVVRQSGQHLAFFIGMTTLFALLALWVVQRPLIEAYPAGLFVVAIFAVVGLHIFTSRLVLTGAVLSARRYGLTIWSVMVDQAAFHRTEDDAGWLVIEVRKAGRTLGSMRRRHFEPRAFDRLLDHLALR